MLELLIGAGVLILYGILVCFGILRGMGEKEEIRKNYQAGTHDYYGNRIK